MATRETRLGRGQRRGRAIVRHLIGELIEARRAGSVSQQILAAGLGRSQSDVSRLERLRRVDAVSFVEVAEVAAMLGLELSAGLHPLGDPIRDRGHQALISRFRSQLSPAWRVAAEVPLPLPGDARSWDLLLKIGAQLIGVEAETRIRDVQLIVRRIRLRERDGGANEILLVLSASRTNHILVNELREALGPRYGTSPRSMLVALRAGAALSGSGVVLL